MSATGTPSAQLRWNTLLHSGRAASSSTGAGAARSPFQRDYDRIIYSGSFRRLADKTQVFPMPPDDHVHTRLTHSLEVSTIGRSLGVLVGSRLSGRGWLPPNVGAHDLGDCVAAACLAHDLGNPPFGHAGEEAIEEFFERHAGEEHVAALPERQRLDLVGFEGNAQSLRLVTNVARPRARAERGLNLCFATLGALVKYPCASDAVIETKGPASRKKHGVNEAEDSRFEEIAHALQLARRSDGRAWQRHPLAFLTEAADDIAYGVIDLEDGLRLGLVPAARYDELLEPFLDAATVASVGRVSEAGDREEGLDRAGALRTATVGALMDQVVEAFDTRHDGILDGSWDMSLVKSVPAASAFQALTDAEFKLCYNSRDVLRMEMAGAAAIQGVLEAVVSAALGEKSLRADRLRALIPSFSSDGSVYDSLLASTDYVSGMTDGYVLRQFRELSGTRLPGGRE